MQPDVLGLLEDIQEAIGFIAEDTSGISFDTFKDDRRRRQAVGWNFAIIGESVNRLRHHAPGIAEQISAVRQIVDFRNAILHGYDVIDNANTLASGSLPRFGRNHSEIGSANGLLKPGHLLKAAKTARFCVDGVLAAFDVQDRASGGKV